ncbi:MAG: MFS transporter [Desulfovibrio sp.]|nr:MFS transporter [Desulfovibrio sp.]
MNTASHPHVHKDAALRTYVCLLLLTSCSYALMYAPQPMFNSIGAEFSVDRGEIGLLVSVFMFSLSISPLCVGLLLTRCGVRRAVFVSSAILGFSGVGIYCADAFAWLLAVRVVQSMLTPVLLTSVMACIAGMFRHLDMGRALAGYVTASLVGSLSGRLGGGYLAEICGWRTALAAISVLFLFSLALARGIPKKAVGSARTHTLREYLSVLQQRGVAPLLFVEACGIFSFAAIGNLVPLRMAELGQGHAEGLIGFMYLGYSVGLVASLALNPLKRLLGSTGRLLALGAALYAFSLSTLVPPSVWAIFVGLWFIALGEFIVHALAPGLINYLATKSGHCDRGMVNGLFLSCYYFGGTLGSWLPGVLYAREGWLACLACMFAVQIVSLLVVLTRCLRESDVGRV